MSQNFEGKLGNILYPLFRRKTRVHTAVRQIKELLKEYGYEVEE